MNISQVKRSPNLGGDAARSNKADSSTSADRLMHETRDPRTATEARPTLTGGSRSGDAPDGDAPLRLAVWLADVAEEAAHEPAPAGSAC